MFLHIVWLSKIYLLELPLQNQFQLFNQDINARPSLTPQRKGLVDSVTPAKPANVATVSAPEKGRKRQAEEPPSCTRGVGKISGSGQRECLQKSMWERTLCEQQRENKLHTGLHQLCSWEKTPLGQPRWTPQPLGGHYLLIPKLWFDTLRGPLLNWCSPEDKAARNAALLDRHTLQDSPRNFKFLPVSKQLIQVAAWKTLAWSNLGQKKNINSSELVYCISNISHSC